MDALEIIVHALNCSENIRVQHTVDWFNNHTLTVHIFLIQIKYVSTEMAAHTPNLAKKMMCY